MGGAVPRKAPERIVTELTGTDLISHGGRVEWDSQSALRKPSASLLHTEDPRGRGCGRRSGDVRS